MAALGVGASSPAAAGARRGAAAPRGPRRARGGARRLPARAPGAVATESAGAESAKEDEPEHKGEWSRISWRAREALQQPDYPDMAAVKVAEDRLASRPPLVFAGECRALQASLAKVASGDGFLIQGGDCAESFDGFETDAVRDTFRVLLQMSLVLQFSGGVPVTKLGRIAGQFAKPRSAPTEMVDGVELDSYRGDIINDSSNDPAKRVPDPARMVTAYDQCANTLNLLRAFATGGYASLRSVHGWNLDFINDSAEAAKFAALADRISETLAFLDACGMDTEESPIFASTPFYTSHEALLLPYEEALTRQDSTTGDWYCTSAHFLWVGERTRQLGKAHLEFLRGVKNPLGVKVSDKASPDEILKVLDVLDPDNTPGRVTLISRMGADALREHYPKIVRAVEAEGRKVVWHSDPMHGNTIKTDSGFKTRKFDAIREELRAFFDAHEEMGTHAGGVHLEMTGQDVTECLGGSSGNVLEDDLGSRYLTHCDPRLNAKQSLELAFLIAEGIRRRSGKTPLFTSPGSSGVGPRAPL